jgi:hypothetical protein
MNLPFGLPNMKETIVRKKDETTEAAALYERKLREYRDTLETYKNCIEEYSGKLEIIDKKSLEEQLSVVQTALDITYLKEQADKSLEMMEEIKEDTLVKLQTALEGLTTAVLDANYKLEGLDKNVVNRLSEFMIEMQKQSASQNRQWKKELQDEIDLVNDSVKRNHSLVIFLIVLNALGLSGILFLVMVVMGVFPL